MELFAHHFGATPLSEIGLTALATYRTKREKEITNRKTPISFVTVNRELGFVRYLLNRAVADKKVDRVPVIELPKEEGRERRRKLSKAEFDAILSHMNRDAARYYIALYEAGMRLREPLKLRWDGVVGVDDDGHSLKMIDLKAGVIRFAAEDVKEKHKGATPITWAFRKVLVELQREHKAFSGCVFRRKNGRAIKDVRGAWRSAVAEAVEQGELPSNDVRPHDLRRSAITRWTALGIPRDIVMACSGHKPSGIHDAYVSFSEPELVAAFAEKGLTLPPKVRRAA